MGGKGEFITSGIGPFGKPAEIRDTCKTCGGSGSIKTPQEEILELLIYAKIENDKIISDSLGYSGTVAKIENDKIKMAPPNGSDYSATVAKIKNDKVKFSDEEGKYSISVGETKNNIIKPL